MLDAAHGESRPAERPAAAPASPVGLDEEDFGGIAVYDGRRFLATLVAHGGGVAASDANGSALGVFPNRKAASHAVTAAARLP